MNYPNFVDTKGIKVKSSGKEYRYVLEIPFLNCSDKSPIIVILKNPSKADAQECDRTVSKVCNATYYNGYGKVIIFNLFPYKSTNAKKVRKEFIDKEQIYREHMNKNMECLKEKIMLVEDVVFAWGTNTISTSKQIEGIYKSVKEDIKTICTGIVWLKAKPNNEKKGKNEPLHGQCWSNTSKFIPYNESGMQP